MVSSQRLYRLSVEDTGEVETRENYRLGGYHPVHYDDYLGPKNRFNVIHKLGWSANSTTWLCLDRESRYYKSVRIMTAKQSAGGCPDLQVLNALSDVSQKELQENCVAIPSEHFWIEGPNGRHLCFVSDLLGPNLSLNSPDGTGLHTPEFLVDLGFQVSKGLQYLHKKGICHGDLRPSNVYMQLHQYTLMELSDNRLDRYLGPRECETLHTISGDSPGPHGPKYLALPASLDKLEKRCRTGKVAIVDFSRSFFLSNPPESQRYNRQYAGPELLFTTAGAGSPQDIWALACTIYEIRIQTQLFSEIQDYASLIRQLELWFGPLPIEYRQVARTYLDSDKTRRSSEKKPAESPTGPDEDNSDPSKPLSMSVEEENQKRERLLHVLGATEWSHPLHASLGERRHCHVYDRSSEGYTSSDITDSESDTPDLDQSSGDENSLEDSYRDLYYQLEAHLQKTQGKGDSVSERSDVEKLEKSDSPASETPIVPLDKPEEPSGEQEPPATASPTSTTPPTEPNVAPLDSNPSRSGAGEVAGSPTTEELVRKREASESMEKGEEKRQRITKPPSEQRELVEREVTMPRGEVLLLSDLLLSMFKHDPKERIDIDAVVNHDYWGDRRDRWGVEPEELEEPIPDPISSRTRSRMSRVEQPTTPKSP
ncbi:kinase-like domain-containing protein [Hypomontagnella monticulosa]|nr:kinase-like domain-containing protein [Hypomontagnella monticulosa]